SIGDRYIVSVGCGRQTHSLLLQICLAFPTQVVAHTAAECTCPRCGGCYWIRWAMIERRAVQNLPGPRRDPAARQAELSFGKNVHITPSPGPRASVSPVASIRNKLPAARLRGGEFPRRERAHA